jgi:hypothetical protein
MSRLLLGVELLHPNVEVVLRPREEVAPAPPRIVRRYWEISRGSIKSNQVDIVDLRCLDAD